MSECIKHDIIKTRAVIWLNAINMILKLEVINV